MKRRTGVQSASAFLLASAFAIGALPALAHDDEGERDRWSYEDKTARGSSVRGEPTSDREGYRTDETRTHETRSERGDDLDREQMRGTGGGTGAGMGDESSSGNEGSRDMR